MIPNFQSAKQVMRSWFAPRYQRPIRRQANRVHLLLETLEDRVTPTVSTFATVPTGPDGLAFDSSGNLYAASYYSSTISKITPGGAVTTIVGATGNGFKGLAFDSSGHLFVANYNTANVEEFSSLGTLLTAAFNTSPLHSGPDEMTIDASNNLYVYMPDEYLADHTFSTGYVEKITPAGSVSTYVTGLSTGAGGLAFNSSGTLFVTNYNTGEIDEVPPGGGSFTTFVSIPGTAQSARDLVLDSSGNVYVAEGATHSIVKVTPGGAVSTLETFSGSQASYPYTDAFDSSGNLYVTDGAGTNILKITALTATGTNVSATEGAAFSNVQVGTLTDAAGTYSNPSDLSATITWGDLTATSAATLVEQGTTGVYTVEGSHTYAQYGSYTISVSYADVGGGTTTSSSTATVKASPKISTSPSGNTITTTTTNLILNGQFDNPNVGAAPNSLGFVTVPDWTNTADGDTIEVWSQGFGGSPTSYVIDGASTSTGQQIELWETNPGTISQTVILPTNVSITSLQLTFEAWLRSSGAGTYDVFDVTTGTSLIGGPHSITANTSTWTGNTSPLIVTGFSGGDNIQVRFTPTTGNSANTPHVDDVQLLEVTSAASVTLSTSAPTLQDSATLSGANPPTGTVTFYLFAPGVNPAADYSNALYSETDPVSGGTASTSAGYTLATTGTVTGTYQWEATYNGDGNNNTASDNNDPAELVMVNPASPTLTTNPSATTVTLSTTAPTFQDSAMLSDAYYATGTVTFYLFAPGVTPAADYSNAVYSETDPLNAGAAGTATGYTLGTVSTVTGTYQWEATYNGDGNNNTASDNSDKNESVMVSPASPTLFVSSSQPAAVLGAGTTLTASAKLAGGYYESGNITFTLYDSNGIQVDSETAPVSGNGTYTTPAGYALPGVAPTGAYQWVASYGPYGNNNLASDLTDNNARVAVLMSTPGNGPAVAALLNLSAAIPVGSPLAGLVESAGIAVVAGDVPAAKVDLDTLASTVGAEVVGGVLAPGQAQLILRTTALLEVALGVGLPPSIAANGPTIVADIANLGAQVQSLPGGTTTPLGMALGMDLINTGVAVAQGNVAAANTLLDSFAATVGGALASGVLTRSETQGFLRTTGLLEVALGVGLPPSVAANGPTIVADIANLGDQVAALPGGFTTPLGTALGTDLIQAGVAVAQGNVPVAKAALDNFASTSGAALASGVLTRTETRDLLRTTGLLEVALGVGLPPSVAANGPTIISDIANLGDQVEALPGGTTTPLGTALGTDLVQAGVAVAQGNLAAANTALDNFASTSGAALASGVLTRSETQGLLRTTGLLEVALGVGLPPSVAANGPTIVADIANLGDQVAALPGGFTTPLGTALGTDLIQAGVAVAQGNVAVAKVALDNFASTSGAALAGGVLSRSQTQGLLRTAGLLEVALGVGLPASVAANGPTILSDIAALGDLVASLPGGFTSPLGTDLGTDLIHIGVNLAQGNVSGVQAALNALITEAATVAETGVDVNTLVTLLTTAGSLESLIFTVSKARATITSTASSAITLGSTAAILSDSAVLASGNNETGSLVFTLSGPNGFSYVQSEPLSGGGNGIYTASATLPTMGTVVGTYTWSVIYGSDANNNGAVDQGGTAEQTVVSAATPTITSTASPGVTLGTTAPTLSDSAVLANGYNETGSLVFTLSGPGLFSYSQSDPLSGNGTYTASVTLPTTGMVAGAYTWHVSFASDANNNGAVDQGGTAEQTMVSPANPTITASPGATDVLGACVPGHAMQLTASATLASGYYETGTVTFKLYDPNNNLVATEMVTASGNGTYTTPTGYTPIIAGTYQWVASYGGDANNSGASATTGSAPEVVVGPGVTIVGNSLYLVGGNTNDQLNITPIGSSQTGSTGISVNGQLNNVNINNQPYSQAFTTIYVVGSGGNDNFQFAGSITIATVICDGDGNDNLQLGNGTNIITLGNGNDNVQGGGGGGSQGGNGNNTIIAGNGNDNVKLGNGTNIITLGNGNDNVQLGNGNNTVTAGSGSGNDNIHVGSGNNIITALGTGNDNIQGGSGNNSVALGTGNDNVQLGDGTNTVTAGATGSVGNIHVQLGDGANNLVTLLGNGNDQVQAGNGTGDKVSITGNGNDQVKLGDGNNDSVSVSGNGNDQVQAGNGNNDSVSVSGNGNDQVQVGNGTGDAVSMVGSGNDKVQTGTGSGTVHLAGAGNKNVHLGGNGWTEI